MPKVDLSLEQIAHTLEDLSPGELETIEIMLNLPLKDELEKRRLDSQKELNEGKTLNSKELFE